MEIFELTPASQNQREWKRGGYGICGLDKAGNTWFNPAAIGAAATITALSSGTLCQVHEVDGEPRMLVSIARAREAFPSLIADLDILDSRIRRIAAGGLLEQYN
jgi:hypothetical protein